ncbi:MAG TPA: hypothetical protein EYG95_02450 [Campylobacterales bacterium]|nr:hypothetical protein [Campylobacterales bacterium]
MKKIVLWCMVVSVMFAKTESDVSLTVGYNKFDDPEYLYKHRSYYGVRAGIYQDDRFGLQLGYEQTNSANCIGLKLKRYYTNALVMTKLKNGLMPYGVGTLGYETSSADADYRPSQAFVGIGAGMKYLIDDNFNIFLETRALKSLKTEDMTIATTLGLGYTFDTITSTEVIDEKMISVPKKSEIVILKPVSIKPVKTIQREENVYADVSKSIIRPIMNEEVHMPLSEGGYFVQVAALTTSSPQLMLRNLRTHGFHNLSVKKINRDRQTISLVVVGPYKSREAATRELSKLKAVSAGAYIKKF